jgi:hypothetical protein
LELPIIIAEGIDSGQDEEQGRKPVHKDGDEDETQEFRHGPIHVPGGVPV